VVIDETGIVSGGLIEKEVAPRAVVPIRGITNRLNGVSDLVGNCLAIIVAFATK
jgi:hypothetical protein